MDRRLTRRADDRAPPGRSRDGEDGGRGRLYDSFVVRVWREAGSGRFARAEVEHVQSAAVAREIGPSPEWVLHALTACLDERLVRDGLRDD